jgi:hypothetical protein
MDGNRSQVGTMSQPLPCTYLPRVSSSCLPSDCELFGFLDKAPRQLLFIEHHDVVNVLAFGILAMICGRPCFSIRGHFGRKGHHHVTVFLLRGFDSVCVDDPQH